MGEACLVGIGLGLTWYAGNRSFREEVSCSIKLWCAALRFNLKY